MEETYQDFLDNHPDISVEQAFCELFRFYPDATVDELRVIFRKEMKIYVFKPRS
jgi:hypothetical protein